MEEGKFTSGGKDVMEASDQDAETIISFDEALAFVQDKLGLPKPLCNLEENKEAFLNVLIQAWCHHIPFQTVTAIATPPLERRVPTLQEVKGDIFSKLGGLCYQHNVGFYLVLRALGFDVDLVPCDADKTLQDMHVALIVRISTMTGKESELLVDLGTGFPSFQAVPLNFDTESPEIQESFLRYKFQRLGDSIVRLHSVESVPQGPERFPGRVKDGWYSFTFIHHTRPVSVHFFDKPMKRIYTEVMPEVPLLSSIRCMSWPDGRFVCIKDSTLLEEKEAGCVVKTKLNSLGERLDAFKRFFPQVSQDAIMAAVENLKLLH